MTGRTGMHPLDQPLRPAIALLLVTVLLGVLRLPAP